MAAPSIPQVVDALRNELAEVASAVDFIATTSSIRPRLGGMLNWAAMDGNAKALAQQFMKAETPHDSLFRGLYVNIAASYEHFVRQLITAGVGVSASRATSFDALRDTLKNQNIYCTGKAFENVFGRRPHLKLDYYRMSADIGSCIPGSSTFQLNAEAFSIDITTPTAEGLDRALERLGIKDYWDDIGRSKGIQRALKAGGVREAHRLAREFLDRFIERRNAIVHAGRGGATIVEADVRDAVVFFEPFGEAVGDIVSTRLTATS